MGRQHIEHLLFWYTQNMLTSDVLKFKRAIALKHDLFRHMFIWTFFIVSVCVTILQSLAKLFCTVCIQWWVNKRLILWHDTWKLGQWSQNSAMEMFITRQWLGKHVPMGASMSTTIEELQTMVYSVGHSQRGRKIWSWVLQDPEPRMIVLMGPAAIYSTGDHGSVIGQKSMVMDPAGYGTKNDCVDKGWQQFTQPNWPMGLWE
jgi:hypothetical protein